MNEFRGEALLEQFSGSGEEHQLQQITERVYFLRGYGSSNATLVIGEQSCLLIDALNDTLMAEWALEDIGKITQKPIDCLIYTHVSHPDHIGGAGVLAKGVSTVMARRSSGYTYGHTELLSNIGKIRGGRQFGTHLTKAEALSTGTGPIGVPGGKFMPLPPTKFIEDGRVKFDIDGIEVVILAAPGETDDQTYIWLPEDKVLCCGDNYYKCWPNLSAIRGSQYRDIAMWIESLDKLLQLEAHYLLPGHTDAIIGVDNIKTIVGSYRDGLEYILTETLKGMDQGMTPDQLVQAIKLPEQLRNLPQLMEFYGTIEWSIRGIYSGYIGWFDGNPTHLGSMPEQHRAEKMLAMMGGAERVIEEARNAVLTQEVQWGLELCDILLAANRLTEEAKMVKADGLVYLGRMSTSANGRHYYLSCAKELKNEI